MRRDRGALISENPELVSDVGLFRVLFLPIQLFTLKYIITEKFRPINIREVYSTAIEMSFFAVVDKRWMHETLPASTYMVDQLRMAGYGLGLIDPKESSKIMHSLKKEITGLSETKRIGIYIRRLKKMNIRFPSYDKFKGVFEAFENLGILVKRGKEGKGITYGVIAEFYNSFKDKAEEILKL